MVFHTFFNLSLNFAIRACYLSHKCQIFGFPVSSVGKGSPCNAGDPGSIPGLGRSLGEGIGYPPQYSWAFLMAQLVKNPPAMRETWVRSLGWEVSLEKGKATHFSILAWRIPWTMQCMDYAVHGVTKSQTWLSDFKCKCNISESQSAPHFVFADCIEPPHLWLKEYNQADYGAELCVLWWWTWVDSSFALLEEGVCHDQCVFLTNFC